MQLEVTFCDVVFEKVAVAVSCWVEPVGSVALAGESCRLSTVAAVTVRVAVALVLPSVAVMTVAPVASPVARPEALIVATDCKLEDQVTELVRFWVEPSLSVPVAVNCWVVPDAMLAVVGVTDREERVAELTVRTTLALWP